MTVRELAKDLADNTDSLDEEVQLMDKDHVYKDVDRVSRVKGTEEHDPVVFLEIGDEV